MTRVLGRDEQEIENEAGERFLVDVKRRCVRRLR